MSICNNRKALHDYFIEDKFEAGLVLEGWEIKAIREARVQLNDSYVKIKEGEVWLLGCHISPLLSASSHIHPDSDRIKKLLLNKREINKLIGKVDQRGFSIVALNLHYSKGRVKVDIALARGKKLYDKRNVERDKELKREKDIALKQFKRIN